MSSHRTIVHLIHGTWGRGVAAVLAEERGDTRPAAEPCWFEPGSDFRQALEVGLAMEPVEFRFPASPADTGWKRAGRAWARPSSWACSIRACCASCAVPVRPDRGPGSQETWCAHQRSPWFSSCPWWGSLAQ